MAAVLDKRKVGAAGNILANRDTSSPAPATQSDVMDKAELYKDQKISEDGYLGTRNTKTTQPAATTDYTTKADLNADKQIFAAETPKVETPSKDTQKPSVIVGSWDDEPAYTSNKETSNYGNYDRLQDVYNQNTQQQTVPQVETNLGGITPEEVRQWLDEYRYYNLSKDKGWVNGFGVDGNLRTMSNKITQQMHKNTQDWHKTDDQAVKDLLHQRNVELEKLIQEYVGGATSTYDPATGKWYTSSGNHGYGDVDIGPLQDWLDYGAEEDYYNYLRTTPDRYYNWTDYRTFMNPVQNEDGYSGSYAPYKYGGITDYLANGTRLRGQPIHADVIGDDFMEEYSLMPYKDANGNVEYRDNFIKPGVNASAYTQQFLPEVVDGIIQTNDFIKSRAGGYTNTPSIDPHSVGEVGSFEDTPDSSFGGGNYGNYGDRNISSGASGSMGGGSGSGDYSSMLEQMYGEALAAQLAQLEQSYNQNLSDLKSSSTKVDNTYNEQKRQADGQSAQNAAAWREMANAYGLNSGAIGQAALAQNNQRQSDLNTLASAQAQAQAEIEQQRVLLGQQYQLQINQAIAENNMQKAEALYQEAVRMDDKLQQQQQYNSNLMLQYAQMAMQQQQYNSDLALQYAKMAGTGGGSGGSGGSTRTPEVIAPNYEAAYQAAMNSGNAYNFLDTLSYLKDYGIKSTEGLAEGYNSWNEGLIQQAARAASQLATQNGTRDGDFLARALASQGFSIDTIGQALDALGIR